MMGKKYVKRMLVALGSAALGFGALQANASEIKLPGTVVWSAYPTGSTGYSHAVAIGSMLQNNFNVNLRVIPGRNDVSRLSPLRSKRAQFTAGGAEALWAQEGLLDFNSKDWGPQPMRLALWNVSDSCTSVIVTAADAGISSPADLAGKRVTWIQGAPSLNLMTATLLSYGNLTWDDVTKVEVSGWNASLDALIDNSADASPSSCDSATLLRLESSPRGLRFVSFPHDDKEAVARVQSRLPWLSPQVAIEGPTIDPQRGLEVFTAAYPMLLMMDSTDTNLVYSMTKAMVEHHDEYKDKAPGAIGWALERQGQERAFLPFHEGAIKYFKEINAWSDKAEAHQQKTLRRQQVLATAWQEFIAHAPKDEGEFKLAWMQTRAKALQDNDMITLDNNW